MTELEKWAAVAEKAALIEDFMLYHWKEDGPMSLRETIFKYFEIDKDKLELERRELLEQARRHC